MKRPKTRSLRRNHGETSRTNARAARANRQKKIKGAPRWRRRYKSQMPATGRPARSEGSVSPARAQAIPHAAQLMGLSLRSSAIVATTTDVNSNVLSAVAHTCPAAKSKLYGKIAQAQAAAKAVLWPNAARAIEL